MTTAAKPIKVGQLAAFVTPAELAQAERFRAMLSSLRSQVRRICVPHIEVELDAARATYVSDPSAGNFQRLRDVHVDLALADGNLISPTFRAVVDQALASCEARIREFAKPILERVLAGACARLAEIEASEAEHYKAATGELPADPLPREKHQNQSSGPAKTWRDTNALIALARQSVWRVEGMLAGLETPDRLLAFLREHAL